MSSSPEDSLTEPLMGGDRLQARPTGAPLAASHRRLILLIGSPRSGTTWLAKILDTYSGVLYRHEPILRLRRAHRDPLMRRMYEAGTWGPADRDALLGELCQAHPDCCRPPFFAKDSLAFPPILRWLACMLVRLTNRGESIMRRAFLPADGEAFSILIKEIVPLRNLEMFADRLDPESIIIVRHPCAVVASLLRGQSLGLMPGHDRARWLDHHSAFVERFGYDRTSVLAMAPHEFVALEWLEQNAGFHEELASRSRHFVVVYEDLCRDPAGVTSSIFAFLGWKMAPQTRRFLEDSTSHGPLSDWIQGKRPYFGIFKDPAKTSVSWKQELTDSQIQQILAIARRFEHYNHYWPETNGPRDDSLRSTTLPGDRDLEPMCLGSKVEPKLPQ